MDNPKEPELNSLDLGAQEPLPSALEGVARVILAWSNLGHVAPHLSSSLIVFERLRPFRLGLYEEGEANVDRRLWEALRYARKLIARADTRKDYIRLFDELVEELRIIKPLRDDLAHQKTIVRYNKQEITVLSERKGQLYPGDQERRRFQYNVGSVRLHQTACRIQQLTVGLRLIVAELFQDYWLKQYGDCRRIQREDLGLSPSRARKGPLQPWIAPPPPKPPVRRKPRGEREA